MSREERKAAAEAARREHKDKLFWINHFRRAVYGKGEPTVKAGSK